MNKTVGVIGAGVIGKGVAQRFAQYGYRVLLLDLDENVLSTAAREITRNLKVMKMMAQKVSVDEVMDRIIFTSDYQDMAEADYIVENVPEEPDIKESVYNKLEKYCKKDCVFMVNTSCIPITLISSFTEREGQVIGVHFMNPVPMKNFSEVIKGWHTSAGTVEQVEALLADIGMETELINDSAGFVSNRLSHLFMNEAAFLVQEGIATAEQIDNIFRKAFGHKMGPLETADLIGLDTVVHSLKILYQQFEDPKFRACPLMKRMAEAKLLGRKSGIGFYNYTL